VPILDANTAQSRRTVLHLAIPVMLSNATVPLVGIVDTAVMSRMGSPDWMAATAVGAVIFSSIFWVFGFLRMATGGLVAQAFGADDLASSSRITIRALALALILGFVLILLQTPLLHIALFAMDEGGEWQALTADYFHVRIFAAPATLCLYAILGSIIGLQKMKAVLGLQLLLNLLNISLTVALFSSTNLGIKGVALATVISEYVTLFVGCYILRDLIITALKDSNLRIWILEKTALRRYFTISGDLFIRTLCLTFAFYWMTVLSARQGVVILAANTVLFNLVHFASYVMDGYAHAVESLTGFAIGKRDPAMLKRSVSASTLLGALTAGVFSLFFWLLGIPIIELLVAEESARQIAIDWLPWVIFAPLVGIWSFLLDGIFIGATETKSMRNSMLISLACFMICTSILVPVFGNQGIWISYFVLLVARTLTLWLRWPLIINATQRLSHD
jgi:MATE family multidrug resistance protein